MTMICLEKKCNNNVEDNQKFCSYDCEIYYVTGGRL